MQLKMIVLLVVVAVATASHPPPYEHHQGGYQAYCDPRQPPRCAENLTVSWCLEDADYPAYEVKGAIAQDHVFAKKYSDIAAQSADDLVETITKEQEQTFDYSFYTGASTGDSPYDLSHWSGQEGYICPSDVAYVMPKRALNVAGEWRVIVNDGHYYSQTARLESCQFPDAACRGMAPCYKSKCTQKYIFHRMLSLDPCDAHKGLFIDVFRMPSGCSCHVAAH